MITYAKIAELEKYNIFSIIDYNVHFLFLKIICVNVRYQVNIIFRAC